MKELNYEKVIAILPRYEDGVGDCAEVFFEDARESQMESTRARSLMKALCRSMFLDMEAQRLLYAEFLPCRNLRPIPLKDRVFFVFKCRHPRFEADDAFGFVSVDAVVDCRRSENGGTLLLLSNGAVLEGVATLRSAKTHFQTAKMVRELLRNTKVFVVS